MKRTVNEKATFLCPYCYDTSGLHEVRYFCSKCIKRKPAPDKADPTRSILCPTCGANLPATCPKCHRKLPEGTLTGTNSIISVVGTRGCGKSHFVGVLIHELYRRVASEFGASFTGFDQSHALWEKEFGRLYDSLQALDLTVVGERKDPLIYEMIFSSKRGTNRLYTFAFFDTAGENLNDEDKMSTLNKYIYESSGIIFLFDPLQIPAVAGKVQLTIGAGSSSGASRVPNTEVLTHVSNLIRDYHGLKRVEKIKTPVAIVFTKLDAIKDQLPAGSSILDNSPHTGTLVANDFHNVNLEVQALLREWGEGSFVRQVEVEFANPSYFAISALGFDNCPDAKNDKKIKKPQPHRIEDPFLWIMRENGFLGKEKLQERLTTGAQKHKKLLVGVTVILVCTLLGFLLGFFVVQPLLDNFSQGQVEAQLKSAPYTENKYFEESGVDLTFYRWDSVRAGEANTPHPLNEKANLKPAGKDVCLIPFAIEVTLPNDSQDYDLDVVPSLGSALVYYPANGENSWAPANVTLSASNHILIGYVMITDYYSNAELFNFDDYISNFALTIEVRKNARTDDSGLGDLWHVPLFATDKQSEYVEYVELFNQEGNTGRFAQLYWEHREEGTTDIPHPGSAVALTGGYNDAVIPYDGDNDRDIILPVTFLYNPYPLYKSPSELEPDPFRITFDSSAGTSFLFGKDEKWHDTEAKDGVNPAQPINSSYYDANHYADQYIHNMNVTCFGYVVLDGYYTDENSNFAVYQGAETTCEVVATDGTSLASSYSYLVNWSRYNVLNATEYVQEYVVGTEDWSADVSVRVYPTTRGDYQAFRNMTISPRSDPPNMTANDTYVPVVIEYSNISGEITVLNEDIVATYGTVFGQNSDLSWEAKGLRYEGYWFLLDNADKTRIQGTFFILFKDTFDESSSPDKYFRATGQFKLGNYLSNSSLDESLYIYNDISLTGNLMTNSVTVNPA